jgi:hypothetical protein
LAKFQRIGPVWRKPKPKPWKQLKSCTVHANFFQYLRDENIIYDADTSAEVEITTEEGWVFVTEQSNNTLFYAIERE